MSNILLKTNREQLLGSMERRLERGSTDEFLCRKVRRCLKMYHYMSLAIKGNAHNTKCAFDP